MDIIYVIELRIKASKKSDYKVLNTYYDFIDYKIASSYFELLKIKHQNKIYDINIFKVLTY